MSVQLEIQQVRTVMNNNDEQATPLWITELGWGSAPPDRFGINKGLEGQQRLLTGAYKLILGHRNAWNMQRLYWFLWRDPGTVVGLRPPLQLLRQRGAS